MVLSPEHEAMSFPLGETAMEKTVDSCPFNRCMHAVEQIYKSVSVDK